MKVLFDHRTPFSLAHGGAQVQIEQTRDALRGIGVDVETLRWWDDRQSADIIHFFGRMPSDHIRMAHQKGIKVVLAELLTAQGSRSKAQLARQRLISRTVERIAPQSFTAAFQWDSYRLADACVALTSWEAHLMSYLFDAPAERVHVVPNGVEDIFLNTPAAPARGPWLVCTATITERKGVVELAEAAVAANSPVWIIGKAYGDSDPYAQRFFALARKHSQIIRFEGPIQDRAQLARIYREARGFVLLSSMESLSLSALEAAACECPLLLSDLPWARGTFGEHASYCPLTSANVAHLKTFYEKAPTLKPPPKPVGWDQIARQLKAVYERVLSTSR